MYSMDCVTPLEHIVERCIEVGINCVAIADHGTIAGALKMKELAPFSVIVAEEILTPSGEIIGLFLTEEIPSNLSVEETLARIKAQDGFVCIPHPFDTLRPSAFKNPALENIMPQVDIIEGLNARSLSSNSSTKALQLAHNYGKLVSAGSDAHTTSEIGNAYVEMPEFNGKDDFLNSLAQGRISGHRSNPLVHFASTWAKLKSFNSGEGSLC